MIPLKFNLKQLVDLDQDFIASKKAVPLIARKVLTATLREYRTRMRGLIPHASGRLQRSFGFSVRQRQGIVTGTFGFMMSRRVLPSAIIAGNVLQKGGATPRKGSYLWIPLPGNRNADGSAAMTARELIDAGGFIRLSKGGNMIAFRREGASVIPMFVLKRHVRLSRPPLPIDETGEKAARDVSAEIPDAIAQVIEAKRAALGVAF